MQSGVEINTVAHVIQQAVAPVFLLTGVGAILGVLTNRLARILDRLRALVEAPPAAGEGQAPAQEQDHHAQFQKRSEILILSRRRDWIHRAITLCTICALLVCLVIAALFLGTELGADPSRLVGMLFITAMASLIGGLVCFLREIALATKAFERR